MFERPGRPSDYWPWQFANENAARVANGGGRRRTCRSSPRRAASKRLPVVRPGGISRPHLPGAGDPTTSSRLMKGYHDDAPEGREARHRAELERLLPRQQDHDAEAAERRPGDLHRWFAADDRPVRQDVSAYLMWMARPDLGNPQEDRFPRPVRAVHPRRPALRDQEARGANVHH